MGSALSLSVVPMVWTSNSLCSDEPAISHDSPTSFIKDLGTKAIASLTNPKLELAKKEAKFSVLLEASFDVPGIAKFALGKYWRQATPQERKTYVGLFEKMLVKAYASKFDGYPNAVLTVKEARGEGANGYMVPSTVTLPDEAPIHMDWKVFKTPKGYRILDVSVDGVSMSITQRSEFASIIERNGGSISQFLESLHEKVS
jgi:phospholipid transport system substrate-binding protein